ncbi:MAG TPA: hypothetical protein VD905_01415 [Flavobacteriales bacterium]|nr:hypothetical protein [Flavobacteriales bacterium]
MKTGFLLLLLFMPVFIQANTNVDSLKRAALQPVINDYVSQAVMLAYEIKTGQDVELIKEYARQLASLSDELKKTIKAFYPHSGGDLISTTTVSVTGEVGLGYATAPYVGTKHPWESYADSISEKANAIHRLCDRSPVKMQKKLEAIVEELREMEGI